MSSTIAVKLISAEKNYPDLEIDSHQSKFILGRNSQTKIESECCAEQQVLIQIDHGQVYLEQCAVNPSYLNHLPLNVNQRKLLKDGDLLQLLENQYSYTIQIDHEQVEISSESKSTLKRQNIDNDEQPSSKKHKISFDNSDPSETNEDDEESNEETRSIWIQQQLNALQTHANKPVINPITTESVVRPANNDQWETPVDGLEVFTSKGLISRDKIAGFDMDGTLILTKSGKVHPTDDNDWRIGFDTCFKKLKQLHGENYKIVVFTNQRGLIKATSTNSFRKKIQFIQQKLNVPLQVFVAIQSGKYRKPSIGSWLLLQSKYNDAIQIDVSKSFYVGDAAGRPDKWRDKAKKDHSCADRLFATNIGLRFYTPEEYFLGLSKARFEMPKFDPKLLRSTKSLLEPNTATLTSNQTEIIVMCGLPASGKSWFVKNHLVPHHYEYVNRDEVGTWQKCVKMAEAALSKSTSVAIDNTNLDKESRQRYIEVAKKFQVSCRCFIMNVSLEHAKHNNTFRQMIGTDDAHKDVNDIVIMGANKRYIKPTVDEGFTEIVSVNNLPTFNDKNIEQLYFQYILDK